MRNSRFFFDAILNVIFPVSVGGIIYYVHTNSFIRNHLPDSLWAYALTSAILIIWDRKIHFFWIFFVLIAFIIFELLQSIHILEGTGDILDIGVYLAFAGIALFTNNYFTKLRLLIKIKPNENQN